jgi:hypothetical protein
MAGLVAFALIEERLRAEEAAAAEEEQARLSWMQQQQQTHFEVVLVPPSGPPRQRLTLGAAADAADASEGEREGDDNVGGDGLLHSGRRRIRSRGEIDVPGPEDDGFASLLDDGPPFEDVRVVLTPECTAAASPERLASRAAKATRDDMVMGYDEGSHRTEWPLGDLDEFGNSIAAAIAAPGGVARRILEDEVSHYFREAKEARLERDQLARRLAVRSYLRFVVVVVHLILPDTVADDLCCPVPCSQRPRRNCEEKPTTPSVCSAPNSSAVTRRTCTK